tara:strand:+ start:518 stop:1159 length:642 start_codon:yes stop_codon:yes gene_type:complete
MKIYGLLEPYISYLYRRPQVDINSNIGKFYYHYHNILILSLFLFSFILFISWPFLDNIGIPPFIIEVLNISSHSYIYSFYILATIICTAFAAIATYLYRIKFGTEKSLLSPLYKVYYNINLPLSYVAINLLVGVVRRVIGLIYSVSLLSGIMIAIWAAGYIVVIGLFEKIGLSDLPGIQILQIYLFGELLFFVSFSLKLIFSMFLPLTSPKNR